MKPRTVLVAAGFLGGVAFDAMLWRVWTPLCNESCPRQIIAAMYVVIVAAPFAIAVAALIATSSSRRPGFPWTSAFILLILLAVSLALTGARLPATGSAPQRVLYDLLGGHLPRSASL